MNNSNIMYMVIIGILLLCGYFYVYQGVARHTDNKSALPLIAIVLLVIYALISVSLLVILSGLRDESFILLALLLLIACIGVFSALHGLITHFHEINKGMMAIFLLYILMVGYVTIFSRSERASAEILLRFTSLSEAIERHSFEPLEHLLMNIAMFVPIGLLFPMIRPGHLDQWRYVLPLGLTLTVSIEAAQLLLRLGQCDLEDMVANTLGALLGLLMYKIYKRFQSSRITEE